MVGQGEEACVTDTHSPWALILPNYRVKPAFCLVIAKNESGDEHAYVEAYLYRSRYSLEAARLPINSFLKNH